MSHVRRLDKYLFEYPYVAAATVLAMDLSGQMKWVESSTTIQDALIWAFITMCVPGIAALFIHVMIDFTRSRGGFTNSSKNIEGESHE